MNIIILACGLSFLAFCVTMPSYPFVLHFARRYDIMDMPNARKLQQDKVPILGGVAVFLGILVAQIVEYIYLRSNIITVGFCTMILMFFVGIWDDVKNIAAGWRFIIEILVVWGLIYFSGVYIDDFHGLWGIYKIPAIYAVPLSVFAGVGIINSINLIDGVDGYSSGYVILTSAIFAMMFFKCDSWPMGCFALIVAGALVPFFLHNVFGKSSKMFIGDGGTLMLGTIMTIFVYSILSHNSKCDIKAMHGMGLVAFTLAVMSVPVFDTLRVMSARIIRGFSPFKPDKTHLHHLYIEMGFSHAGTTLFILLSNFLVVLVWYLCKRFGHASITWQLYIVVITSMLLTFGFYKFMKVQQLRNTRLYRAMCRLGAATHIERTGFWLWLKKVMDSKLLGGKQL